MKPNNRINVIATAAFADLSRYGKKKSCMGGHFECYLNCIQILLLDKILGEHLKFLFVFRNFSLVIQESKPGICFMSMICWYCWFQK